MWETLQLEQLTTDASTVDRAGSSILEELPDSSSGPLLESPYVGVIEVVVVAAWYLWWIRRTVSRNDRTSPAAS